MGHARGFLEVKRVPAPERDPRERTADHGEIFGLLPEEELRRQGGRCMDCGIPFCHDGCPLGNLIPDWNDLVTRGRWREAIDQLHATNDFPELTGYICPAPCEDACVLEINDDPVMIKQVELSIVERAWEEGWIVPRPPEGRSGRSVAVVGSGPAGMAAAAQLNRRGHRITIFERDEAAGGLNRFGVPDHKLEKWILDRRLATMVEEGIELRCGVDVGRDLDPGDLHERFDAVVVAVGARVPRALEVPGADLAGVHSAMDYLYDRNRAVAVAAGAPGAGRDGRPEITAASKRVIVVGAGDTSADCMSNAHREGAATVIQLDTYPQPAADRPRELAGWPRTPKRLPTNYALEEGGERRSGVAVVALHADGGGRVGSVEAVETDPETREPLLGTDVTLPADLVLVAIGFSGPEPALLDGLDLERDGRGNVLASDYATSLTGVFCAGDARIGQSLTVTAIDEGRKCARAVHRYLESSG